MMSALRLAERISLGAIKAVAYEFYALQSISRHTLVKHSYGCTILETRHRLSKIVERHFQTSFGPRGHEES